jgi:hypothetical protein
VAKAAAPSIAVRVVGQLIGSYQKRECLAGTTLFVLEGHHHDGNFTLFPDDSNADGKSRY